MKSISNKIIVIVNLTNQGPMWFSLGAGVCETNNLLFLLSPSSLSPRFYLPLLPK
jgi:hypothetical protein